MEDLIPAFVDALVREIQLVAYGNPYTAVHTIFFGGGTPSLLSPEQFRTLISAIRTHFAVLPDAEVTIEANPNDLDTAYLTALREVGINRLSIGMQSANAAELALFARRHDYAGVVMALEAARRAGFDNVNLDLIYGIPNQTLADWQGTLNAALALTPEHVSMYALGLEEGTPLHAWVEGGRQPHPDDDLTVDMYELATDCMEQAGYLQYEISNWSKPGYECRHNMQYWHNWPYVGLGPGAHGYAADVRYSVILSPQRYIKLLRNADEGFVFPRTPVTADAVVVDQQTEIAETLMMGLRLLQHGISREEFRERFGTDIMQTHENTLQKFAGYGLLEIRPDAVRLTRQGRMLSNAVFRELI